MNINELADELIGVAGYCIKAATMLRQQQAENLNLKRDLGLAKEVNGQLVELVQLHREEVSRLYEAQEK